MRKLRVGCAYVEHRLELLMIWENICNAASPTASEPCVYAGTSCPLKTSGQHTTEPDQGKHYSRPEDAYV